MTCEPSEPKPARPYFLRFFFYNMTQKRSPVAAISRGDGRRSNGPVILATFNLQNPQSKKGKLDRSGARINVHRSRRCLVAKWRVVSGNAGKKYLAGCLDFADQRVRSASAASLFLLENSFPDQILNITERGVVRDFLELRPFFRG